MFSQRNKFALGATTDSAYSAMILMRRKYNQQFSGISKMSYNEDVPWADGGITLHGFTGTEDDMYPMHVGIRKEFMAGSRPGRLSDIDMTRMIVAVGHETGHLEDMLNHMRTPDDPVGLRLSVETIAANDNQAYYVENYTNNECEIRAEKRGIIFAKETLVSLMQANILKHDGYDSIDECVEQKLVDYVNFRIGVENDGYFIAPKQPAAQFSKLTDIESAFDDAIEKSVVTMRVYPETEWTGVDVFPRVVGIAGQSGHSDYQVYGEMFKAAITPYEQNLMISTIAAQGFSGDGHGGYFAKWFPALKNELPMYPLTHGIGNKAVREAHCKAFCDSIYNSFADAAKRLQQKDPDFVPKLPSISEAPRIYADCRDEAARFHYTLVKSRAPGLFDKAVSNIDKKLHRRDVGPEFDVDILNKDPESSRDVSDLSL